MKKNNLVWFGLLLAFTNVSWAQDEFNMNTTDDGTSPTESSQKSDKPDDNGYLYKIYNNDGYIKNDGKNSSSSSSSKSISKNSSVTLAYVLSDASGSFVPENNVYAIQATFSKARHTSDRPFSPVKISGDLVLGQPTPLTDYDGVNVILTASNSKNYVLYAKTTSGKILCSCDVSIQNADIQTETAPRKNVEKYEYNYIDAQKEIENYKRTLPGIPMLDGTRRGYAINTDN